MSDFLAGAGVLAAAGAAAAAILLPPGRARAAAMLAAIVLFPVLILGDQWHSTQIVDIRDPATLLVGLALAAFAVSAALAALFHRWPILFPLAVVLALPFRVPLHAGGESANLLVPLYLVIAGGALASAYGAFLYREPRWPGLRTRSATASAAGGAEWGDQSEQQLQRRTGGPNSATGPAAKAATILTRLLAAFVVLYAIQVLYSADFSKGLQNVCFFLVPFSVTFALLRDYEWDRRLLTAVLWALALEAVAFVVVGSVEYATRSLFWNDHVIRSNAFHTYFRVNSVFWDPNIYGRSLALVMVIAVAAMLWARRQRQVLLLAALTAVLWIGLVPTFSQSSFIALLAGLAVLAAVRWSLRWTLAVVGVGAVAAAIFVAVAGGSLKINLDRINVDTSGRANLVSGGAHLFGQRPVLGYGSGSFQRAYRAHSATKRAPVSASHTEPVTIAAEQGVIGLIAYGALILAALWALGAGLLTAPGAARAAVFAAFVALLVHSLAYAGFFEDPITWSLLAVGACLAAAPAPSRAAAEADAVRAPA